MKKITRALIFVLGLVFLTTGCTNDNNENEDVNGTTTTTTRTTTTTTTMPETTTTAPYGNQDENPNYTD